MDSLPLSEFHAGLELVLAHVIQDFMRSMKQHGLSTPQIHALMYIYHAGGCQVSDLGTLAEVSNAAASQLVDRLVQQGLVDRKEDPANRRTKILRLTEQGMELIRGSVPSNHIETALMASLTSAQRKTIQAAFRILIQAARQIQTSDQPKDSKHA